MIAEQNVVEGPVWKTGWICVIGILLCVIYRLQSGIEQDPKGRIIAIAVDVRRSCGEAGFSTAWWHSIDVTKKNDWYVAQRFDLTSDAGCLPSALLRAVGMKMGVSNPNNSSIESEWCERKTTRGKEINFPRQ